MNYLKQILITVIILTKFSFAESQILENVQHGSLYNKLKIETYESFLNKYKSGEYFNPKYLGKSSIFSTINNRPSTYALSTFPQTLTDKDYEIAGNYKNELEKLCEDYNDIYLTFYNDFENCTKKSFAFLQLQLKRFEILSNYYMIIYNNKVLQKTVNKEIEVRKQFYLDSIKNIETEINDNINNDFELNNLLKQKQENASISTEVDNNFNDLKYQSLMESARNKLKSETSKIESQQKVELKGLSENNYQFNKEQILKKYRPKIDKLNSEYVVNLNNIKKLKEAEEKSNTERINEIKQDKINSINSKDIELDNKIKNRRRIIEENAKIQLENLNSQKYHFLNNVDFEINEKYNLKKKLNDARIIFEKEIDNINIDIAILKKK